MIWTWCPICCIRTDHIKESGRLVCVDPLHGERAILLEAPR